MASEITVSVDAIYAAYADLVARCCDSAPVLEAGECVAPSLAALYVAVQSLLAGSGTGCGEFTAAVDDPGEPGACLDPSWLAQCQAWIEGIVCDEETLCSLNLNSNGGDEGYDRTFQTPEFAKVAGSLNLTFEAYNIKDRLIVSSNLATLWDTGCVSGNHSTTVTASAGTTWVRVQVIPNCEGTTGTAWTLSVACAISQIAMLNASPVMTARRPVIIIDDDIRAANWKELREKISNLPEENARDGVALWERENELIENAECTDCRKNRSAATVRVWLQTVRDKGNP